MFIELPFSSALYHGNGANSSGRSSNCDDGDMQSDISLEDDVIDLNQKVGALMPSLNRPFFWEPHYKMDTSCRAF